MTEEDIVVYLEDNGFPAHIVTAGSDGLIRRWQEFVDEVERGYSYGLNEYRHDLDIRAAIALFQLEDRVSEADERFAAMLTNRQARVWESGGEEPWWDFGYPRNARGYLARGLREARLLEE
ncbi:MAG: hypothetical protein HYX27_02300 [Acidobacteria bacterium]|nr:hypothetical protein [Acidobacteriota bacterium]